MIVPLLAVLPCLACGPGQSVSATACQTWPGRRSATRSRDHEQGALPSLSGTAV